MLTRSVLALGTVVAAAHAQTHYCPSTTSAFISADSVPMCCDVAPIDNTNAANGVTCELSADGATYSCTYSSAGDTAYAFEWPSSVSTLSLTLSGAAGGTYTKNDPIQLGGSGATLTGTLDASAYAEAFEGAATAGVYTGAVYVGAYGGAYYKNGGNGGGFSSFGGLGATITPGADDARLVIAGGGGGGSSSYPGGDAGFDITGTSAYGQPQADTDPNGWGGTLTAPGVGGGTGDDNGDVGSPGGGAVGGAATTVKGSAGGGGGGYYGGGGGGQYTPGSGNTYGSGGGGSSYAYGTGFTLASGVANPATSAVTTTATGAGVTIAYTVACVPKANEPTNQTRRKRAALEARQQQYLKAHPDCSDSQRACPLPSGNFECIEFNELSSCGGCVSEGTGVDCLALPGIDSVTCINDQCVAISCAAGYSHTGDDRITQKWTAPDQYVVNEQQDGRTFPEEIGEQPTKVGFMDAVRGNAKKFAGKTFGKGDALLAGKGVEGAKEAGREVQQTQN
ncbi:hypothetical protein MNV49_005498 [Pseudohyphozyma bogoriensis]|nr:hypothetical protein MNV49_005498 [Pseudohyphozyma bogoriensis]